MLTVPTRQEAHSTAWSAHQATTAPEETNNSAVELSLRKRARVLAQLSRTQTDTRNLLTLK